MTICEMNKILKELSTERRIFHSEADFKHALAWKIQKQSRKVNVRLEKREKVDNRKICFDIFIFANERITLIELKYKTKKFTISDGNEQFSLKKHGAIDQGGYDFLKDISRIEKFVMKDRANYSGFALILTNDQSYWSRLKKDDDSTSGKDFRIHDERKIEGTLNWAEGTSEGSKGGRTNPIELKEKYTLKWSDYSNFADPDMKLRYLLVPVGGGEHFS